MGIHHLIEGPCLEKAIHHFHKLVPGSQRHHPHLVEWFGRGGGGVKGIEVDSRLHRAVGRGKVRIGLALARVGRAEGQALPVCRGQRQRGYIAEGELTGRIDGCYGGPVLDARAGNRHPGHQAGGIHVADNIGAAGRIGRQRIRPEGSECQALAVVGGIGQGCRNAEPDPGSVQSRDGGPLGNAVAHNQHPRLQALADGHRISVAIDSRVSKFVEGIIPVGADIGDHIGSDGCIPRKILDQQGVLLAGGGHRDPDLLAVVPDNGRVGCDGRRDGGVGAGRGDSTGRNTPGTAPTPEDVFDCIGNARILGIDHIGSAQGQISEAQGQAGRGRPGNKTLQALQFLQVAVGHAADADREIFIGDGIVEGFELIALLDLVLPERSVIGKGCPGGEDQGIFVQHPELFHAIAGYPGDLFRNQDRTGSSGCPVFRSVGDNRRDGVARGILDLVAAAGGLEAVPDPGVQRAVDRDGGAVMFLIGQIDRAVVVDGRKIDGPGTAAGRRPTGSTAPARRYPERVFPGCGLVVCRHA